MRIRYKILLLVSGICALFFAVVVLGIREVRNMQEAQFQRMAMDIADVGVASAVDALRKGNMHQFTELLKVIAEREGIKEFSLLTPKGKTLYSSQPDAVGKSRPDLINSGNEVDPIVKTENR